MFLSQRIAYLEFGHCSVGLAGTLAWSNMTSLLFLYQNLHIADTPKAYHSTTPGSPYWLPPNNHCSHLYYRTILSSIHDHNSLPAVSYLTALQTTLFPLPLLWLFRGGGRRLRYGAGIWMEEGCLWIHMNNMFFILCTVQLPENQDSPIPLRKVRCHLGGPYFKHHIKVSWLQDNWNNELDPLRI